MVTVESAGFKGGNYAKISLNDMPVFMPNNESGNDRGLHMVIVDAATGVIQDAQIFDTYKTSDALKVWQSKEWVAGDIVVAACKDDCANNLSEECKEWFENMGSKEIWRLKPGQAFAFIGTKGGFRAVEKRGQS